MADLAVRKRSETGNRELDAVAFTLNLAKASSALQGRSNNPRSLANARTALYRCVLQLHGNARRALLKWVKSVSQARRILAAARVGRRLRQNSVTPMGNINRLNSYERALRSTAALRPLLLGRGLSRETASAVYHVLRAAQNRPEIVEVSLQLAHQSNGGGNGGRATAQENSDLRFMLRNMAADLWRQAPKLSERRVAEKILVEQIHPLLFGRDRRSLNVALRDRDELTHMINFIRNRIRRPT